MIEGWPVCKRSRFVAGVFVLCLLAACSDAPDLVDITAGTPFAVSATDVQMVCDAAAQTGRSACSAQCDRLGDELARVECAAQCDEIAAGEQSLCTQSVDSFVSYCTAVQCDFTGEACLSEALSSYENCASVCPEGNDFCANRCLANRQVQESTCGFSPVVTVPGVPALPDLPLGVPAELSETLDAAELALVETADERARMHRQREVLLLTGVPGADVTVTQVEHAFRFGIPLDSREFEPGDGRLAFYGDIGRKHTNLLVAETSLKWRNTEREKGALTFDLADFELAWAESLGSDVKAHVLLWGNPPPLASGSGTPDWLREEFPSVDLIPDEQTELKALIRARIDTVVGRYRGRIDVWEVTNEMLNPITSWFVDRLGPEVVNDAFRWARAADPGAELVYNEWISDIFTGLGGPDAVAVRDRVIALLEAGVQVDALGQQGHFAPGLVNVGIDEGLDQRTRIDDYAQALDTLAEAGLPIHITEVTFAAPEEPAQRAAQAEAVMRLWWGHPQVEEIIFWNFWNPLGPRSRLNLGLYDDGGNLTRHGEAMLSLLNDRWRTRVRATSGDRGEVAFRGTFGQYVAHWQTDDGPETVRFDVPKGTGLHRVLVSTK